MPYLVINTLTNEICGEFESLRRARYWVSGDNDVTDYMILRDDDLVEVCGAAESEAA